MPYSGSTFQSTEGTPAIAITWYICDSCGREHRYEQDARACCLFTCDECGATHNYEEDAIDCCAYYCPSCGERHYDQGDADNCCYDPEYEDDYHEPEPATYPSEILDTVVSYPILIPEIAGRPARLCSLEQELSSGGSRAAKLLHDLSIAPDPYIQNYSHSGHPGLAVVKGDGSLPAGGAEVVYSRFNLADRIMSQRFSEGIWRLREMKRQRLVTTSRQAGTHIHISATGIDGTPESVFGPANIAALYEIWSFCEDVMFKLASAGWESHRGVNYTRPVPKFQASEIPSPGRVIQQMGGQRYFSLNFTRLLQAAQQCRCGACAVGDWRECNCGSLMNGTIEWRVFNASTKPETIHGWLILTHALTAKAMTHQLGSLPEANGYEETDAEKHAWIFSWILNECPMTDVEKMVLIGLAKRSPGLAIDWEDFERHGVRWLEPNDDLDDEQEHEPQPLNIPITLQQTSSAAPLPTWVTQGSSSVTDDQPF